MEQCDGEPSFEGCLFRYPKYNCTVAVAFYVSNWFLRKISGIVVWTLWSHTVLYMPIGYVIGSVEPGFYPVKKNFGAIYSTLVLDVSRHVTS